MSYHEHDLARLTVSYGVALSSWALPFELSVGSSADKERGFCISFLCLWFGLHWFAKSYPVPRSVHENDTDGTGAWEAHFNPQRDTGYQVEALDLAAENMAAIARDIRNSVDLLRELTKENS